MSPGSHELWVSDLPSSYIPSHWVFHIGSCHVAWVGLDIHTSASWVPGLQMCISISSSGIFLFYRMFQIYQHIWWSNFNHMKWLWQFRIILFSIYYFIIVYLKILLIFICEFYKFIFYTFKHNKSKLIFLSYSNTKAMHCLLFKFLCVHMTWYSWLYFQNLTSYIYTKFIIAQFFLSIKRFYYKIRDNLPQKAQTAEGMEEWLGRVQRRAGRGRLPEKEDVLGLTMLGAQ